MVSPRFLALPLAVALLAGSPQAARACLSCSCGGSGTSADLGAAGGAAAFFGMGSRWLLQQGLSLRAVTGAFNERGGLSSLPAGGSLWTAQGTLAVHHFPRPGLSVGLQAPLVGHRLDRASWGMFGSVEAGEGPSRLGGGLGDPVLQGSVTLFEHTHVGLAAWGSASLPLGRAVGEGESLTGLGFATGAAGLAAVGQWGAWEATANVGHQRPLGLAPVENPFALGPSLLYQAHLNHRISDAWRIGMGVNGYVGGWVAPGGGADQPSARHKVLGTAQWSFSTLAGLRLALGADPAGLGSTNAMQDVTLYAIGYQYLP